MSRVIDTELCVALLICSTYLIAIGGVLRLAQGVLS